MSKLAHHGQQQLQFSKRENEEECLKFLEIFSQHYSDIDKNYKLFWRTIFEECQKQNIFPETTLVKLYSEVWPNFLIKARNNLHSNGLTKVDQIVMDISKTRNPHWWGPPLASKNARARAIRDFNPPKVKIIEPQHAAATPSTGGGRGRKRKDPTTTAAPAAAVPNAATPVTPAAPAAKVAKPRKKSQVNIDYKTPLTSKPRQPRRRKDPPQQQQLPSIPETLTPNIPGSSSAFKVPALPTSAAPSPAILNPTTLSTIAALIRSLSSAQSNATTAAATASSQPSSSSAALPSSTPSPLIFQFPRPPHPTPATPSTPILPDSVQPIFNFDFLPPPPKPPTYMEMMNIEAHPTINDNDAASSLEPGEIVTKDVNENFNPLQESTSFHLKLSSDDEEY